MSQDQPQPFTPETARERVHRIIFGHDTPTGIVTVELGNVARRARAERVCQRCELAGHDADATSCKRCGDRIAGVTLETSDSTVF